MNIFSDNTTLQLSKETCLLKLHIEYYQRRVQELETALYHAGCVVDENIEAVLPLQFSY